MNATANDKQQQYNKNHSVLLGNYIMESNHVLMQKEKNVD
jgi:hypothetical protein